jgi:hypothetical protein
MLMLFMRRVAGSSSASIEVIAVKLAPASRAAGVRICPWHQHNAAATEDSEILL